LRKKEPVGKVKKSEQENRSHPQTLILTGFTGVGSIGTESSECGIKFFYFFSKKALTNRDDSIF